MSEYRQSDKWDADMAECPMMFCGRLDMSTYNAVTGAPQKMVYFDGEEESVTCEGQRADYVAYAANRYQPLVEEIERLRAELAEKEAVARRFLRLYVPRFQGRIEVSNHPWLEEVSDGNLQWKDQKSPDAISEG